MSKLLKRLNDNQNKVADTNGIMKLQAWDDGVAKDLTNKQVTATVANASGFLFDLDLVSNGTEIDLDFKDSQLQKLTPDTYFIEIKVTDKDGDVSVFPTEGYATFTINKNLHATEGALVPQITFDTVLENVEKTIDKKVAEYVKTIAKGDKGDKGDPGKDAEMPVIGVRNLLLGTSKELKTITASGWGNSPTNLASVTYGAGSYYASAYIENTTPVGMKLYVGIYKDGKFSHNVSREVVPAGQNGVTSFKFDILEGQGIGSAFVGFTKSQTESYTYKYKEMMVTRTKTDWTPAPEDIQSDITKRAIDTSVVHNTGDETVAGNKTYVGDSTYMGTNTFMDGLSLNGKNVVNGVTDTGWLNIPLAAGRTGEAKYKVSLGKVFIHLGGVKGVTATGNNTQGQVGTLPINPNPYYTRYIGSVGPTIRVITIAPNGVIYVANSMGNTMSENDSYLLDIVLM